MISHASTGKNRILKLVEVKKTEELDLNGENSIQFITWTEHDPKRIKGATATRSITYAELDRLIAARDSDAAVVVEEEESYSAE